MKHAIRIPSGKWVSAGQYVAAWRAVLAADPRQSIKGWEWYPVDARDVLRDMRRMLQDIITRHDTTIRRTELSPRRLADKVQRAIKRGAIVRTCRWCGCELDRASACLPSMQGYQFCDVSCRRSYHS